MNSTSIRFGFDLDNTLIDYSASVQKYCQINNLKNCVNIGELRQLLRKSNVSNNEWQIAQCWLYTTGLNYANFSEGALDFIYHLYKKNIGIYIVSHKTEFTPNFCERKNLRHLAFTWLKNSEIINVLPDLKNLYFEDSRQEKIAQINRLSLDYFVDDLFEVLDDPNLSKNIIKFLIGSKNFTSESIKCAMNFIELDEMISHEL